MVAELGDRSNVHILRADLTSYASLKQAAADTAKIVGERGIDYLIANEALMSHFDAYDPIGALYVYFPLATVRAGLWLTPFVQQGRQSRRARGCFIEAIPDQCHR